MSTKVDMDNLISSIDSEAKRLKQTAINHAAKGNKNKAHRAWDKAEGVLSVKNLIQPNSNLK